MIKMAEVVNGVLEVLPVIPIMEANGKKPCELDEAKYDRFTEVRVNQGRKWKKNGFRKVENHFVEIFWLP
jgi:hypothetical protein